MSGDEEENVSMRSDGQDVASDDDGDEKAQKNVGDLGDSDSDDDDGLDVVVDFGDAAFSTPRGTTITTTTKSEDTLSSTFLSSARFPRSAHASPGLSSLATIPFFLPASLSLPTPKTLDGVDGSDKRRTVGRDFGSGPAPEVASPLTPAMAFDLATLHERDKPWLKPGAKMQDYFNHGFDERTYVEHQKKCLAFLRSVGCEPPSPVSGATAIWPTKRRL